MPPCRIHTRHLRCYYKDVIVMSFLIQKKSHCYRNTVKEPLAQSMRNAPSPYSENGTLKQARLNFSKFVMSQRYIYSKGRMCLSLQYPDSYSPVKADKAFSEGGLRKTC